jgi:predicted nucleic acid-binding protein
MPKLYLDTSAILRAILESGTSPDIETRIRSAEILLTSRLSTVEASRAINRLRHLGQVGETQLADVEREIESLWSRCEVWELTPAICESARRIAPNKLLRALDALHLATFILARQRIADLEMLTVDQRLQAAVGENRKGGA